MVLSLSQEGAPPVLRVALNMNNTALVQRAGEGYTGPAARIAALLGAEMGAPLSFLEHADAQSVVRATPDGWDIAFLAIDPARGDRIAFSDPYSRVAATFLVRDSLPLRSCAEVLQGDHRILGAQGAVYQARLSALAPRGAMVVAASPGEARERFRRGEGQALAGIRETLAATDMPGTRLLADDFALIEQAVAVPLHAGARIAVINRVLSRQHAFHAP